MLSRLTGLTSHPLTWAVVHRSLGDMGVNNILALVDLIHSLPPTTVLNETQLQQNEADQNISVAQNGGTHPERLHGGEAGVRQRQGV